MNPYKYFNKWWLMLSQGILLVFLSYFLFSHADKFISVSGNIAGFIALLIGSMSIMGYFFAGKTERNRVELISGILCCFAGLFILSSTSLAHNSLTWFFGFFMIFNATMLANTSWHLKYELGWWWYSLIIVAFSVVVSFFLMNGKTAFDIPILVFAGLQFFVTGIVTVVLAFVVRKLQREYVKTVKQIRGDPYE